MMVGAQLRGLSISAFDLMNPGQIVDYCIEYNSAIDRNTDNNAGNIRNAGQLDFDMF